MGDPGGDDYASVSPDGKKIVFVRYAANDLAGLFLVDAAGGSETRLTPDTLHAAYPRWSPDGKTIAFTQIGNGGSDAIWTVPASGGDPTQITHNTFGNIAAEADWSPGGDQIVYKFYVDGSSHNDLHVASADGSNDHVLWTGDYSFAETPDWRP